MRFLPAACCLLLLLVADCAQATISLPVPWKQAMPLQAQLDDKGAYRGLRNWQQLGAAMREVMLPVLVAQSAARKDLAGTKGDELQAMLAPALERLTTQAAVDASLGRQMAIFNYF